MLPRESSSSPESSMRTEGVPTSISSALSMGLLESGGGGKLD
jgi:hypothetical protein